MKNLKCFLGIHNWAEVKRTFHPPTNSIKKVEASSLLFEPMERFINIDKFGYSILETKCQNCGEIKIKDFMGKI